MDPRIAALNLYRKFRSSKKVSQLIGIHHSTICRWVKRIQPIRKVRKHLSLCSCMDDVIQTYLVESPMTTQS